MKPFIRRLSIALSVLLPLGGQVFAQSQPVYIDGQYTISDGEQWYSDVTFGPNAEVYVPNGAKVYFYGAAFKAEPGAKIYGASGAAAPEMLWTVTSLGTGNGLVTFYQPNPMDSSAIQQTIDGGNAGTAQPDTLNTFTGIEINNTGGVALLNTPLRIGTNVLFTSGHLFTGNQDALLASTATLASYTDTKYVVTDGSGHLVKEDLSQSFTFPVGHATADYTPAIIVPAASGTVHVNVTDYAGSASVEEGTDGMDRTWNIFGDNATGAMITLQHNSATNQANWNVGANFITQYGVAPNNSGDNPSFSAWQSNNVAVSSVANGIGTEGQSRAYAALATSAVANEAWFSKASNISAPLPLIIASFTAKADNCNAVLSWTAGHIDAGASFTVQRSNDGRSFSVIGRVAANSGQDDYSYTDRDALSNGSRFYRLSLNEPNGSSRYSNILEVNACGTGQGSSFALVPNPAYYGQTVELVYQGTETEAWCQITDVPGQVLQRSAHFRIGGGAGSNYTLRLSGMASGAYIVTLLTADDKVIGQRKLVIQ